MRKFLPLMLLAFVSTFFPIAAAQSDAPLLLRFPTVSKTQIVFTYGDDLWIVARDGGGDARRLTSGIGMPGGPPAVLPDGSADRVHRRIRRQSRRLRCPCRRRRAETPHLSSLRGVRDWLTLTARSRVQLVGQ